MQYYRAFLVCRHLSSVCLKLIGKSAFESILQERNDKALWLLSFFPPTLPSVPANGCVLSLLLLLVFKYLATRGNSALHRTIQTRYYGYTGKGDTF